jgi:hypothetical protein
MQNHLIAHLQMRTAFIRQMFIRQNVKATPRKPRPSKLQCWYYAHSWHDCQYYFWNHKKNVLPGNQRILKSKFWSLLLTFLMLHLNMKQIPNTCWKWKIFGQKHIFVNNYVSSVTKGEKHTKFNNIFSSVFHQLNTHVCVPGAKTTTGRPIAKKLFFS